MFKHGEQVHVHPTQHHNATATSKLIKASIKSSGLPASQPVVHTTNVKCSLKHLRLDSDLAEVPNAKAKMLTGEGGDRHSPSNSFGRSGLAQPKGNVSEP